MLVCGEPLALSLQSPHKMSYLFSDVRAESDLPDVMELLRLYLASGSGGIDDARSIGRLRFCLKGRLPPPCTMD